MKVFAQSKLKLSSELLFGCSFMGWSFPNIDSSSFFILCTWEKNIFLHSKRLCCRNLHFLVWETFLCFLLKQIFAMRTFLKRMLYFVTFASKHIKIIVADISVFHNNLRQYHIDISAMLTSLAQPCHLCGSCLQT